MEPTVVNFRRGRHHQNCAHVVIKVADSTEEAQKLVGKNVTWTSPAGKVLKGTVSALHGRTGSVRAVFSEAGLPGQALGQKVKIE